LPGPTSVLRPALPNTYCGGCTKHDVLHES
jgi:hypothetical protein